MIRELEHDFMNKPMKVNDLEALLVYMPWASKSHRQSYEKAISAGYTCHVKFDSLSALFENQFFPIDHPSGEIITPQVLIAIAASSAFHPPHILPSDVAGQRAHLLERFEAQQESARQQRRAAKAMDATGEN